MNSSTHQNEVLSPRVACLRAQVQREQYHVPSVAIAEGIQRDRRPIRDLSPAERVLGTYSQRQANHLAIVRIEMEKQYPDALRVIRHAPEAKPAPRWRRSLMAHNRSELTAVTPRVIMVTPEQCERMLHDLGLSSAPGHFAIDPASANDALRAHRRIGMTLLALMIGTVLTAAWLSLR